MAAEEGEREEVPAAAAAAVLEACRRTGAGERLREHGWAVVDAGPELGRGGERLRGELAALAGPAAGGAGPRLLKPNRTKFVTAAGEELVTRKPHVFEGDLHDAELRGRTRHFRRLFDDRGRLAAGLAALAPHLRLVPGEEGVAIKVQFNEGHGGCFPVHYDNPARPNRRKLTMLAYLNAEWAEGDGGELELFPFLERSVVISPTMNRLVLFESDLVLHRVRPARAPRFCFTVWLDGAAVNAAGDLRLDLRQLADDEAALVAFLRRSPAQRLLSRGVYQEEYEASLRDCMAGAPGFEELQEAHDRHLASVRAHPAMFALTKKLRGVKSLEAPRRL